MLSSLKSTTRGACCGLVAACLFVLVLSTATLAQFSWDTPRENLQVLPDTISGEQLRATMLGFARSLGVRCTYCHDDSEGSELEEIDFASDVKPEKEIARLMMRMTQMINSEFVARVSHGESPDEPAIPVTCLTCHRGENRPLSLEEVLYAAISAHGSSAGRDKYHELREEHYGRMAYDFSGRELASLGRRLLDEGKTNEAIDVFRLGVEAHPDTWHSYDNLARAYFSVGDTVRAIAFWEKCLQVDPGIDRVAEQLEKLR